MDIPTRDNSAILFLDLQAEIVLRWPIEATDTNRLGV